MLGSLELYGETIDLQNRSKEWASMTGIYLIRTREATNPLSILSAKPVDHASWMY
jgi:hypothetical protein